MVDFDEIAPNYRRACQQWPEAPTLSRSYEALAERYRGSGHGLVEHVKSLVESVCLTIMGELGEAMPSGTPTTTELLVAALKPLGLRNTRGASKLDKVLSGFNKLADALQDIRNEEGPVAHGRDGFLDSIEADHARAFLHAGDAILGVLLNAFEGTEPNLLATREPYDRFPHLNDRIDRAVSVRVHVDDEADRPIVVFSVAAGPSGPPVDLRVEPSRLLYGIDREAYIDVLKSVEVMAPEPEPEGAEAEEPAHAEARGAEVPPEGVPAVVLLPGYEGTLADLRPGLDAFLRAEGIEPGAAAEGGGRLLDSLLATAERSIGVDWKAREPIQASLKVASKRVLVLCGVPGDKAEPTAAKLLKWLLVQGPAEADVVPREPGPAPGEGPP